MMRKLQRDHGNARLVRANLGVRRTIISWGVRPSWSICAVWVVMLTVQQYAPTKEDKATVQRLTLDMMARNTEPREIIRQLWVIERYGRQVGW